MFLQEIIALTDERLFVIATALHQGYIFERLFELTKINPWFLQKFYSIIQFIDQYFNSSISKIANASVLREAKKLGFSYEQIGNYFEAGEDEIRELYKQYDV